MRSRDLDRAELSVMKKCEHYYVYDALLDSYIVGGPISLDNKPALKKGFTGQQSTVYNIGRKV